MRRAPKERRSLSPSLANRAAALANLAWPSANRALFRESSSTAGESSSPPANRARLHATRVSGEGGEAASAPPANRARLPATRAPAREARRRALHPQIEHCCLQLELRRGRQGGELGGRLASGAAGDGRCVPCAGREGGKRERQVRSRMPSLRMAGLLVTMEGYQYLI
ncbi:hypothetical protein PAHAL_6G246300 [Panicum hallii]|uniref:Uncharacterized protein n=1 Tax=Panicum hallii TaxID=206008 RepID=A0A2T8IHG4_9POAL|nr:hypothetical protein PAHAL_6G246300 [Panicum hallii]